MYECKCGQSIYKQSGDDQLTCYNCGRTYEDANSLSVIHVLCPWCSTEITDVGRYYVSHDPERWTVDNIACPNCDYQYEASIW